MMTRDPSRQDFGVTGVQYRSFSCVSERLEKWLPNLFKKRTLTGIPGGGGLLILIPEYGQSDAILINSTA